MKKQQKAQGFFSVIFNWLKKYKWDLLLGLAIMVAYLAIRLVAIVDWPVFVDEAIYLRWAQIAKNDASWRFISLTDGKQPLFVWLVMVVMRFIKDPLLAGRLVATLVGLGTMTALWFLAYILFKSRRIAFLSAIFYLISPFALVYDRMVLMDGLVAFFSILSLIVAIILVKTQRLDVALIFGGVLGGGVLTKTSGFLSIYLLPLTLALFNFKDKKWFLNLVKWIGLAILAAVIAMVSYSILRLSPFFHIISDKNALFIFPLWEWLGDPFYYFVSNFRGMTNWLVTYLTIPWICLAVFSLGSTHIKIREKFLISAWFLLPFMGLITLGRILYPRFIFFMSLPLLILVAFSLVRLWGLAKRGSIKIFLVILAFAWPIFVSYTIIEYPSMAAIPESDRSQYVTSWPSGHGIDEIILFAKRESKDKEIFIGTEGTFGLMPASLELYLWDRPNITIKGYFPVEELPSEVLEKTKALPTYFVFNETQQPPGSWPIELVAEYPRPDLRYSMKLYRVLDRPSDKESGLQNEALE